MFTKKDEFEFYKIMAEKMLGMATFWKDAFSDAYEFNVKLLKEIDELKKLIKKWPQILK